MRIAVGCDHVGVLLKEPILEALEKDGHAVLDLGTFSTDSVDYPDFARAVSHAVRGGFVDAGLLICDSGTGASIAANKVKGIRAAFCPDPETARQSREEDDANLLCLSGRSTDLHDTVEIVRLWLASRFSGADTHVRLLGKIARMEDHLPTTLEQVIRAAVPPRPARVEHAPVAKAPESSNAGGPPRPSSRQVVETTTEEPRPETRAAEVPSPARTPRAPAEPAAGGSAPGRIPVELLPSVAEALTRLEAGAFVEQFWVRDARLWSANPEEHALIRNRLGWLTSPALMREKVGELREFAELRRLYSHVVFLGVDAGSLAAEVFAQAFDVRKGFSELLVLSSADPAAVKQVMKRVNLARTLFIVASKSGTTAETLALFRFFWEEIGRSSPQPGQHFVAVTDGGTPLERLAKEERFRRVFLNPPTLAGPHAAISYFGLVPAALMGVDLETFLARTEAMVERSLDSVPAQANPGVVLGATLAGLARDGRDKVTLALSPRLRAFGSWVARLLDDLAAGGDEGLLAVEDEPLGEPSAYGTDRVFVAVTLHGEDELDAPLRALEAAGHPVLRTVLRDPLELGAEFFRWEVATVTAATLLGINPFHERAEQKARDSLEKLVRTYRLKKRLPELTVDCEEEGILLVSNQGTRPASVTDGLSAFLAEADPGDHLALLAYLPPEPGVLTPLRRLRALLRDRLRVATTLQLNAPCLNAADQLQSGGSGKGLYIQIICDDAEDLAVPGEQYTLGVLKNAQALASLQALGDHGQRVLRLHLDKKPAGALERLVRIMEKALKAPARRPSASNAA